MCKINAKKWILADQKLTNCIEKIKDKSKHTIIFIDHIGLLKYQNKKSIYEEATEIVKELRKK